MDSPHAPFHRRVTANVALRCNSDAWFNHPIELSQAAQYLSIVEKRTTLTDYSDG